LAIPQGLPQRYQPSRPLLGLHTLELLY